MKNNLKQEDSGQEKVLIKKEKKTSEKTHKETKGKKVIEHKKSSVFGMTEVIGLIIITMVVSVIMTAIIVYALMSRDDSDREDRYTDEIIKQYNYIINNYYETIDKEKLADGAIKGMLEALDDEHSTFIDEASNTTFDKTLEGSYEGVGIEVYSDGTNIIVLRCFENTPAYEAGIRAGDKILAFNNHDLKGQATTVLSNYIAEYDSNKTFTLTYERDGKQDKVEMKKKYVVIPSVTSKTYEQNNKKIGYLGVSQFSATTYHQFKVALEKLEAENIDSLIIDLRDNTGGHLSVVSDMLSLFMDKTHVIYQIQTKDKTEKFYSTGKKTKNYPIIILQNGSSASASELMSSALKEQLNATVVGTSSYGKGTVQELIDLNDGNEYKFTTKKWLTSKGEWINGKGVTPTVEVELNDKFYETLLESDDNQLQTALQKASE